MEDPRFLTGPSSFFAPFSDGSLDPVPRGRVPLALRGLVTLVSVRLSQEGGDGMVARRPCSSCGALVTDGFLFGPEVVALLTLALETPSEQVVVFNQGRFDRRAVALCGVRGSTLFIRRGWRTPTGLDCFALGGGSGGSLFTQPTGFSTPQRSCGFCR